MNPMHMLTLITATLLSLVSAAAWAHKPSDSYLQLDAQAGTPYIEANWHIALRDLDGELHLDADDDGRLTWGEVRSRWTEIRQFALPHLRAERGGEPCTLADPSPAPNPPAALIDHTDGTYAVLRWRWQCPAAPGAVRLHYDLFALSDPTHRGVLRWQTSPPGGERGSTRVAVLGVPQPDRALDGTQALASAAPPPPAANPALAHAQPEPAADGLTRTSLHSPRAANAAPDTPPTAQAEDPVIWQTMWTMVREGVHHIAIGTDHVLFLVTLLLVAVWRRPQPGEQALPRVPGWLARDQGRDVALEALRLVSAFTLAHSVTLGLATYGVLSPPSQWVESLIALSVLVAAIDNLWPIIPGPRWVVVFIFGLVHGFGFAGVMQDLGLERQSLLWPLLGFNLGVELGQLALVAVFLPIAFWLRHTWAYRWLGVQTGSSAIAVLAALWLYERSTDSVVLGW